MGYPWTCVVITCPTLKWASVIEKELVYLQKKGRIPSSSAIITVEDPGENIGSGAATLNALLVVTEYLSAQQNFTVLTADVLSDAHILILHHGRDYSYDACGRAFINLPLEYEREDTLYLKASGIITNIEYLLQKMKQVSMHSPPGVWVCSTDMLLYSNVKDIDIPWERAGDAVMFCVYADIEYATKHGAVNIDFESHVQDIVFCGSAHSISSFSKGDGKVPLISGIVFLSVSVAESLLSLHVISPLDSCTYMGLDSGADPIQVSLFFDILIAMATGVSKEAFLSGRCGKTYNMKAGFSEERMKGMVRARTAVWNELSKYSLTAEILIDFHHLYWCDQQSARSHMQVLKYINPYGSFHTYIGGGGSLMSADHLMINSLLFINGDSTIGAGSALCNSSLEAETIHIGKECLISGIKLCSSNMALMIPDRLVAMGFQLPSGSSGDNTTDYITVIFGLDDNIMLPVNCSESTFCNISWRKFFNNTGITFHDLWEQSLEEEKRNLLNARLYPCSSTIDDVLWWAKGLNRDSEALESWKRRRRLSLVEIWSLHDHRREFKHRRDIYQCIARNKLCEILYENKDVSLLPYFYTACAEACEEQFFNSLDSVALSTIENKPSLLSRVLSCVADLLGTMAGKTGGLRSGPGNNKNWTLAFEMLKEENYIDGIKELKKERQKWLDRPDYIMRAARHYERAVQVLIQRAVESVQKYIHLGRTSLPPFGVWVTSQCPARIDLQGGWTDTPPICYELGGSVVNVAVQVDGQKPVGAKVCLKEVPELVFVMGADEFSPRIVIKEIADLLDYNQPTAQGALVKAAVICTELVDVTSNISLQHQLFERYNGGFELHTWSLLPQGSGLGTSSILAGAVIAVLWTVSGRTYDKQCVLHAVLYLEQLLTTGGGWQDQVGGIMGGLNRGYSEPGLPIHINVQPIIVTDDFLCKLNEHLLLIYTGKVRLAKNLLQNVIRNWYARDEIVVGAFTSLLKCSMKLATCLKNGDLEGIGSYMNEYWKQKKTLAVGSEPIAVKTLMEILSDHTHGSLLVGAGGGGYMCILTRQPNSLELVKTILRNRKVMEKVTVHNVNIDTSGLVVSVGDQVLSL